MAKTNFWAALLIPFKSFISLDLDKLIFFIFNVLGYMDKRLLDTIGIRREMLQRAVKRNKMKVICNDLKLELKLQLRQSLE